MYFGYTDGCVLVVLLNTKFSNKCKISDLLAYLPMAQCILNISLFFVIKQVSTIRMYHLIHTATSFKGLGHFTYLQKTILPCSALILFNVIYWTRGSSLFLFIYWIVRLSVRVQRIYVVSMTKSYFLLFYLDPFSHTTHLQQPKKSRINKNYFLILLSTN